MKNLWPVLVVAALAYAFYTGWNPLAGMMPAPRQPNTQAGGAAVVRQVEQMPQAMNDFGGGARSSAAGALNAARQGVQHGGSEQ